jgi:ABC-type multidrug transport system fused ATPase/permease subunit
MVAHRLAASRIADRVVVMSQGAVADAGAPDELLGRPGPFRDLWRMQDRATAQAAS